MTNITLPRAELQAALDALQECRQKIAYLLGNIEWYESAQAIDFADISIKAISARLAVDVCAEKQPDVEKTSQRVEKTAQRVEKTAQQGEKPEPVAWDVFVKHSYIYFSIGNQSFQLAMVPEDEPDMSAGQIAAWYMTQLRTALARLASTLPPQRPWVGLTDEEIRNEAKNHVFDESFFSGAIWARGKMMGKNYD